ncbi:MAG TPA: DUF4234 domain-containing protein [Gaiellaceae bacterium]|nr:DUF4234 domain-containing protein [Gaiellaceae bacterium]
MADELQMASTTVKIRNPFLVFVWSIVTFGIYYLVWYYKINRELRDARGIDVSPVVALIAVSLGWIVIVPPFVSWYRTFERIAAAQRAVGTSSEANPILGFILYVIAVFMLPVEVIYAQDELNKLWRASPDRAGMAPRRPWV